MVRLKFPIGLKETSQGGGHIGTGKQKSVAREIIGFSGKAAAMLG